MLGTEVSDRHMQDEKLLRYSGMWAGERSGLEIENWEASLRSFKAVRPGWGVGVSPAAEVEQAVAREGHSNSERSRETKQSQ